MVAHVQELLEELGPGEDAFSLNHFIELGCAISVIGQKKVKYIESITPDLVFGLHCIVIGC